MTLADECRRMADLLPGAPGVADLLRRAATGLESVQVQADALVHRTLFDRGALAMQRAVQGMRVDLTKLEGRP